MKKAKLIRSKKKRNFNQLCDQDYLDQLNPADRAWILKFNNEFYRGSNLRSEDSIHSKKKHVQSIEAAVRTAKREVDLTLEDLSVMAAAVTEDPSDLLITAYDLKNEKPPKR